jgi:hypothetical protein
MMVTARSDEARTVTVQVPITIRKRGGRKLVLAPGGAEIRAGSVSRHVDSAFVKAIARAFRWRDMLESDEYATVREIARAEKINESYVGRVLRLTLLAPDIVERVLAGSQPPTMQLDNVMQRFSVDWRSQREELGIVEKKLSVRKNQRRRPSSYRCATPPPSILPPVHEMADEAAGCAITHPTC